MNLFIDDEQQITGDVFVTGAVFDAWGTPEIGNNDPNDPVDGWAVVASTRTASGDTSVALLSIEKTLSGAHDIAQKTEAALASLLALPTPGAVALSDITGAEARAVVSVDVNGETFSCDAASMSVAKETAQSLEQLLQYLRNRGSHPHEYTPTKH
jgi:hypothetical protein